MTAPLAITTSRARDGATILTVTGEIDMSNAGELTEALENTTGRVIVDLAAVDYLDSAGLAVLFAHAERIALVANPQLSAVLLISGLADLTTVHGLPLDDPGTSEPDGR